MFKIVLQKQSFGENPNSLESLMPLKAPNMLVASLKNIDNWRDFNYKGTFQIYCIFN